MLTRLLYRLVDRLPQDALIIDGLVYMRRYYLFNPRKKHDKRFMVRLHEILEPDPGRDFHDHPFDFASLIIAGDYIEARPDKPRTTRRRWSWAFRPAEAMHRITIVAPNTWTLVFTGPIRRQWGFMTSDGWIRWDRYEEKMALQVTGKEYAS